MTAVGRADLTAGALVKCSVYSGLTRCSSEAAARVGNTFSSVPSSALLSSSSVIFSPNASIYGLSVVIPIIHDGMFSSSSDASTTMPPKFLRNRASGVKYGLKVKPMSLPMVILEIASATPPTDSAHAETTRPSAISS